MPDDKSAYRSQFEGRFGSTPYKSVTWEVGHNASVANYGMMWKIGKASLEAEIRDRRASYDPIKAKVKRVRRKIERKELRSNAKAKPTMAKARYWATVKKYLDRGITLDQAKAEVIR